MELQASCEAHIEVGALHLVQSYRNYVITPTYAAILCLSTMQRRQTERVYHVEQLNVPKLAMHSQVRGPTEDPTVTLHIVMCSGAMALKHAISRTSRANHFKEAVHSTCCKQGSSLDSNGDMRCNQGGATLSAQCTKTCNTVCS